ncbi:MULTISPECIES: sensor histidine kinase [unclassified Nocardioides]|uniref:sensor histidine kinase n=1 Tax=unclassified Nocardioides TaxID=2615069 RepID=UPI0009F02724|nr:MULTISPECIES: GAF domain-containing sensor histidine kinase [unclassified Nocardioides]GAW51754.1 ATPase domain-containing protein [Nocardioides sp. PD653-B2]GAW55278.1 ATPase domain-containing protein [Nocardioides sp. PD653]
MSEDAPDFVRPVRGSRWSDTQSRDALQAIAEGVAEVAGFDLVGISVAREDGYLHTLALVGPEEARRVLVDSLAPVDQLLVQLETAEDWGALKFIPHDKLVLDIEKWGWFSDAPRDNVAAGAWHPEDMLIAPLEGADGGFLGFLGMELPRDGLVPSAEKRALLEIYARQAGRAVVTTLERERLAERVRLAGTAADIVRLASGTQSPEALLAECGREVTRGFRADSLWVQLLGPDHRCDGPLHVDGGPTVRLPSGVRALVSAHAQRAWERQCVAVLAPDRPVPGVLGDEQVAELLDFFASVEVGSLLFVPLGAGPACFGVMGLTRGHHGAEWSDEESAAALDIGRDLGRALANARTFAREHELVQELQDLADYKGRLVATVSHELKNPLSAILGYVEMLESEPSLSDDARAWIAAIQRGGDRLARVVGDLLLLHELTDADDLEPAPVDLAPIVDEVLEMNAAVARGRGITLTAEQPPEPTLVLGVARDLDQVVTNLVSNAVKYSTDGGSVTVRHERVGDEVVLTCADDGFGISEADQAQLFAEFFRSSNPAAVAQPGTGLGLAIVRRIVVRHGGRIEVESELGRGSTFRVYLPSA